jgi:hypothetical protein
MRVLADDVDVIEFECRIAHLFAPIGGLAAARAGILPSAGYNDHHNGEGAAKMAEFSVNPTRFTLAHEGWERDTSIAEPVEPKTD